MALGAQKNLTFELYKIFVESGCHLSVRGVYALCRQLTEQDTEFLREILLKKEFNLVGEEILSVLKMNYWKYSVYLDIKKLRIKKEPAGLAGGSSYTPIRLTLPAHA